MKRHSEVICAAMGMLAVFGLAVVPDRAAAQLRSGMRGSGRIVGHSIVGARPRGHASFFFSSRPFFSHRNRSSFYFSIGYGGFGAAYYSPYYCTPYYYQPIYYPLYYPITYPVSSPTVVYHVYPDDYSRPRNDSDRQPAPSARSSRDDFDDYYLNRPPSPARRDPSLRAAIDDIERAFRSRDMAPLEKHVVTEETITVVTKGTTRRSIPPGDYLAMTHDALRDLRTESFVLDRVEPGSNGTWLVSGKHVVRDEGGDEKSYVVGFVLKKSGDTWMITEVSGDRAPDGSSDRR